MQWWLSCIGDCYSMINSLLIVYTLDIIRHSHCIYLLRFIRSTVASSGDEHDWLEFEEEDDEWLNNDEEW